VVRWFPAIQFCAVSFSQRRSTAVSATRAAPAWGLGSPGPWPPATPHGQPPTPYLYKTPPKNISDPKNSRVTDPKIPEVSAWRAMANALHRGRSGPAACAAELELGARATRRLLTSSNSATSNSHMSGVHVRRQHKGHSHAITEETAERSNRMGGMLAQSLSKKV